MQSKASIVVVLGTGGTIAGTSAVLGDDSAYVAAQISVAQLVNAVPELAGQSLECEQVAQVDSKDMSFDIWVSLARRVTYHLARGDVAGVVVTHGTDTLEETAYFLHRVVACGKPVVLTGAMRPASSVEADGPRNLLDAVQAARSPNVSGVVVVLAGEVHSADDVRKAHASRLDAFQSGDAGPLARIHGGQVARLRNRPASGDAFGVDCLPMEGDLQWPRVEIVYSHAGADGRSITALHADGAQGIVVAATGGGTVHHALEDALILAQQQGLQVLRATRCGRGRAASQSGDSLESAGELSPVKARIELMLRLIRPRLSAA